MAAPALIAAIPALLQMGMGYQQRQEAKSLASQSPQYNTPDEILDLERSARKQARDRDLPGQDLITQSIGASTSRGATAIKNTSGSGADSMAAITALYGMEMDSNRDLGIKSAENFNSNQSMLRNALAMKAGYADKEFDFNQWQPYMAKSAAASSMRGAGQQNMMGGATNLATLASAYMDSQNKDGNTNVDVSIDNTDKGMSLSGDTFEDSEFEYGDGNDAYMKALEQYMQDPTTNYQ